MGGRTEADKLARELVDLVDRVEGGGDWARIQGYLNIWYQRGFQDTKRLAKYVIELHEYVTRLEERIEILKARPQDIREGLRQKTPVEVKVGPAIPHARTVMGTEAVDLEAQSILDRLAEIDPSRERNEV